MSRIDSIVYDKEKVAAYQADRRFDYDAQLDLPDYSWFDMLSRWFNDIFNSIFSGSFGENVTKPVMIILFLVMIAAILAFIYNKRPELFMRNRRKKAIPYDVEKENIHEINFDVEIDSALRSGDYRLAVRLVYLQTLRILSDSKQINWQIHKTPTEYLYEVKDKGIKLPFSELTNHFLHVRYGNRSASVELYETMVDIQRTIKTRRKEAANEG